MNSFLVEFKAYALKPEPWSKLTIEVESLRYDTRVPLNDCPKFFPFYSDNTTSLPWFVGKRGAADFSLASIPKVRQPTTVTGWTPLWLHRSLLPVVVTEIGKLSSKYGCISPSEQGPTQNHTEAHLRSTAGVCPLQSHGFAQKHRTGPGQFIGSPLSRKKLSNKHYKAVVFSTVPCRTSASSSVFGAPMPVGWRTDLPKNRQTNYQSQGPPLNPSHALQAPPHKPFSRRYSNSRMPAFFSMNEANIHLVVLLKCATYNVPRVSWCWSRVRSCGPEFRHPPNPERACECVCLPTDRFMYAQ